MNVTGSGRKGSASRRFSSLMQRAIIALFVLVFSVSAFAETGSSYVMLQGFHWNSHEANSWWNVIADNASTIANAGFDMVWLPPASDAGSDEGYLPRELANLSSKYGSRQGLIAAINALHANDVKAIADIVINHRVGKTDWADFVNPDWGTTAVTADDEWPGSPKGNPDSGEHYDAARDIDHTQEWVRTSIKEWMNWLKSDIGYDGWRYDFVKGFSGSYVGEYNDATSPVFSVGEFWPTSAFDPEDPGDWRGKIIGWMDAADGKSYAFDFVTKPLLAEAFRNGQYWRLDDNGKPTGVIGYWPGRSVTFLDNHDTGPSPNGGQDHWPFPSDQIAGGYAYILTHPGVPSIYWMHFFDWGTELQNTIKELVSIRKTIGIHSKSAVSIEAADSAKYAAIVDGTQGQVAMKIGPGDWSPSGTDWQIASTGNNYAVWTRGGGPAPVNVNVYYKSSWTKANIHYDGGEGWTTEPGEAMTEYRTNWFKRTVVRTAGELTMAFNNDSEWDRNGGQNYTSSLDNLWVMDGQIHSEDPEPGPSDKVRVHYYNSWSSANMHYNGGDGWTASPGEAMQPESGSWYLIEVDRSGDSLEFVFNNGTEWDNNNQDNYTSSLDELWVKNQTVYDQFPEDEAGVVFSPAEPVAGQEVTVTYNGPLKNSSSVTMHWACDTWSLPSPANDSPMSKSGDSWTVTVTVPEEANATLDCVFFNENNNWDNNGESNYHASISLWNDLEPPTVSISSPAASETVSGDVAVAVSASDNIGISKVALYEGNTKLGEDSTAPYTFTYDSAAAGNGEHTLTVRAYDAAGNSADDAIAITVNNQDTENPTVDFSLDQGPLSLEGMVTVSATATDNAAVDHVYMLIDNVAVQTDTQAPYSFQFDSATLSDDEQTLTLKAVDTAGLSADKSVTIKRALIGTYTQTVHYYYTGSAGNVFVQYKQLAGYNSFPGEKMTAGTANWYTWSKTVAVQPMKLRFVFSGGSWDNNSGSDYEATANEIWVKDGTVHTSNPDQPDDSEAPQVSITSPQDQATVSSSITITPDVSDNVGVVRCVLYVDSQMLAEDTSAPFSFSWDTSSVNNGTHNLKVAAFDAANNTADAAISVLVDNGSQDEAPVVSSLSASASPAAGTVTINAEASDDNGVSKVSFYLDSTLLGEDTSSPYSVDLDTTAHDDGSYTLKAVATDTVGQTGEKTASLTIQNTAPDGRPYATNPTMGHSVNSGDIVIDGANNGEWSEANAIALDVANDDPRSIGENWTMHETPWDLTHLWAAWDDEYLYLAWQYVDVTDIIDPANAGSSAGTKPNQMNLIQWIAIDTVSGSGASHDMWGKNGGEPYWAGNDKPEYQIYLASNLWQGYIGQAVDGVFAPDSTDPSVYQKFVESGDAVGTTGIEVAVANTLAAMALWGVGDADDAGDSTKLRDFVSEGHDGGRDTFYEIKIPLSYLGLTKAELEANGIGVMLGQGAYSCMDTIPNDPATSDTPGTTDSNSPREWEDEDTLTVPFARVAK